MLPLRGPASGKDIDLSRVAAALEAGAVHDALALNLKQQSDALYAGYLGQATRFSLTGFLALTALLLIALRSPLRVARVLAPLLLAVLAVAAALVLSGVQLTILHLVGLLLIVAVGSNYALFFDRQANSGDRSSEALTLASLVIANAGTVMGFGLLAFSQVPVLVALGTTVAPAGLRAAIRGDTGDVNAIARAASRMATRFPRRRARRHGAHANDLAAGCLSRRAGFSGGRFPGSCAGAAFAGGLELRRSGIALPGR